MAQQKPSSNAAQATNGENKPRRFAVLRAALLGRLSRWSKRTKIAVGVIALLVVIHFVALVVWVPKYLNSKVQRLVTLPMALQALDRHSFMEAKALAKAMQQSGNLDSQQRSGTEFVLGAAAVADAESLPENDRQAAYLSAVQHLEQARALDFPENRQSQGLFLLGKSLYLAGKCVESRAVLEEALNAGQHANAETYNLLAVAYSHDPEADWNKARQYSEQYLAQPSLSEEARDQALLLSARILDHLGDRSGCQAALTQIPLSSAAYAGAELFQAELLMREAKALATAEADDQQRAESNANYQQAAEKLKEVQSRGNVPADVAQRVSYLLGLCEIETGDTNVALDQFRRVREQSPTSAVGIAATFQSAEMLRCQGCNEEAISLLRHVVQAIVDPTTYHNDLLSVDDLRKYLLSAYEADLQTSQFDEAAQIARLLQPIFPPQRELELTGDLLRAAGKSYLSKAATAPADVAKTLAAKGRSNLRRAGQAFDKLAELQTTSRTYTDDLWNAADCYLEGHDYSHAAETLELYLKNELRRRRATALLLLGEARLTLGETDKALANLQECINTYASDPASHQARLLAAKANLEKGETTQAEEMLRTNLESGNLTPRSAEWRNSLFALGSLLQISGCYEEAIERLQEAVDRYPDAPQAVEARYSIAECYRHLGQQAQQKMAGETIEKLRLVAAKQMQQYLNAALEGYRQTIVVVTGRQQENIANPLDSAILRNCYFAMGATLYDLTRYEEAVRAFSEAVNLCRNEPEALEAFVQIANCYRKLNRPEQARGTIAQAQASLKRIDKNANFSLVTNYTREEWGKILNEMAEL